MNDRQPDTPYEYSLTEMVGNYLTDDKGNIMCYGNMSETYRLIKYNSKFQEEQIKLLRVYMGGRHDLSHGTFEKTS